MKSLATTAGHNVPFRNRENRGPSASRIRTLRPPLDSAKLHIPHLPGLPYLQACRGALPAVARPSNPGALASQSEFAASTRSGLVDCCVRRRAMRSVAALRRRSTPCANEDKDHERLADLICDTTAPSQHFQRHVRDRAAVFRQVAVGDHLGADGQRAWSLPREGKRHRFVPFGSAIGGAHQDFVMSPCTIGRCLTGPAGVSRERKREP